MASESAKTSEVMKFAIMAGIAIAPSLVTFGIMQSRIDTLEKSDTKRELQITNLESHNVKQDISTATWRTNTDNRIQNIEKLTQDIHRAVVGD